MGVIDEEDEGFAVFDKVDKGLPLRLGKIFLEFVAQRREHDKDIHPGKQFPVNDRILVHDEFSSAHFAYHPFVGRYDLGIGLMALVYVKALGMRKVEQYLFAFSFHFRKKVFERGEQEVFGGFPEF